MDGQMPWRQFMMPLSLQSPNMLPINWTRGLEGRNDQSQRISRPPVMRWCHHCRAKKLGSLCCNEDAPGRSGRRDCRKVYCDSCLSRYYSASLASALEDPRWVCPYCKGVCVCTHCKPPAAFPENIGTSAEGLEAVLIKKRRKLSRLLTRSRDLMGLWEAEMQSLMSLDPDLVDDGQIMRHVTNIGAAFDSLAVLVAPQRAGPHDVATPSQSTTPTPSRPPSSLSSSPVVPVKRSSSFETEGEIEEEEDDEEEEEEEEEREVRTQREHKHRKREKEDKVNTQSPSRTTTTTTTTTTSISQRQAKRQVMDIHRILN